MCGNKHLKLLIISSSQLKYTPRRLVNANKEEFKMKMKWFLFFLVLPCLAQAGIVQSASYTQQGLGDLNLNFDSLTLQGHPIVDWMIFDDSANNEIYSQKANTSYLLTPEASGAAGATNLYNFSWSDGDPIQTGNAVSGLGFSGYGTFRFKTSVPVAFGGIFRLYVGALTNDTYTISTVYAGDNLTVDVSGSSFGFIDINFSNTTAYAETILVSINGQNSVEPHFYANVVSEVPEPRAILFLGLSSVMLLWCRRTFCM